MSYVGCQLATDYKVWPKNVIEMAVEPKLDGYRLTAIVTEGRVSFHCRNPKQVDWHANLEHIGDELLAMGFKDCMIDGEVMGSSFNTTGMVRSKPRSNVERAQIEREIKFHVFDYCNLESIASARHGRSTKMVDATPFCERRAQLASKFVGVNPFAVKLVEMFLVETEHELLSILDRFLTEGHEGGMAKDWNAPYVCDRTSHWLKLKPTETMEAQITGCVEGTGKYTGMLGAFECLDAKGNEVSVGTGFVDAVRADYWIRRAEMIGKIIEVKKQKSSGSFTATARHPVFVRERPDRTSLEQ